MSLIKSLVEKLPKDPSEDKFQSALEELTLFKQFNSWDGAVVVGVFPDGELLFIKRSEQMKSHRGQIAFLGGTRESEDKTPIENALREFEEETGFHQSDLEVLGITPPVVAGSGLRVVAVPCLINIPKSEFSTRVQSNGEWDFMFTVPWSNFEDLNTWVVGNRYGAHTNGKLLFRPIYGPEWETVKDYQKRSNTETLHFWGASARMLWNLMKITGVHLNHD